MESPRSPREREVKVTSIGILDLILNLSLTQSKIESFGINIDRLGTLSNLFPLFSHEDISILDLISLSTNNFLINTLLYINRAFKQKTFIEYIITSEIAYSSNDVFFKSVIKHVTDRHLLFLIENKITTISSKVSFTLNIKDNDENNKTIHSYSFSLGDKMSLADEDLINSGVSFYDMLTYQFTCDYFICSINDMVTLLQNDGSDELNQFFKQLTKQNLNLQIISLLSEGLINEHSTLDYFDSIKEIMDLSDVIVAESSELLTFYKIYRHIYNPKDSLTNRLTVKDALLIEATAVDAKKKKKTSKMNILLDKLKTISVMMLDQNSVHTGHSSDYDLNYNTEDDPIIKANYSYFQSILIGGFLSRLLYKKTFQTCYIAGAKSINKAIYHLKHNIQLTSNLNHYEVVVSKKNNTKDLQLKLKTYYDKREKGFVLDCMNPFNSKINNYNPIKDKFCSSFYNSIKNLKFLKKQGYMGKKGEVIPDPQKPKLCPEKIILRERRKLVNMNIKNRLFSRFPSSTLSLTNGFQRTNHFVHNGLWSQINKNYYSNRNSCFSACGPKHSNLLLKKNKWYIKKDSFRNILDKYQDKACIHPNK